jgi:hypothetical protein
MLENLISRELLVYLNKSLGKLLPRARLTLWQWIMDEYAHQQQDLKAELLLSKSKIHLFFDIWTMGNWYSMISIYTF